MVPRMCNITYNCKYCRTSFDDTQHWMPLNLNILEKHTLSMLQKAICNSTKKCKKCSRLIDGIVTKTIIFCFDVEPKSGNYSNIKIEDIQQQLNINGCTAELRGLIDFIPPTSSSNPDLIGHFRCLVKRMNNNWELYDDVQPTIRKAPLYINPTTLVYVKK